MISTDSVQRPSWALDSAPWSGEPNPIGLWASVAPALYRGGGGTEARRPRVAPTPTYRPTEVVPEATGSPLPQATAVAATAARRRHHQHWYCTSSSTSNHSGGALDSVIMLVINHGRFLLQEPVSSPSDLLLDGPKVLYQYCVKGYNQMMNQVSLEPEINRLV